MDQIGEFKIIEAIRKVVGPRSKRVLTGIGDDTAVLEAPHASLLATVDMLVEGIHFDLSYMQAAELGRKAMAVNLSDIAAMAGEPLYALVSLGLRENLPESFVTDLYSGMVGIARQYDVEIVGGNLVRSPERLLVDITLLGEAVGSTVNRKGASVGDLIAVTGYLGSSAAGLACLKRWGNEARTSHAAVVAAHLRPEPRIPEGRALNQSGAASAMIDISDGLASELHHLAGKSKVGMLIDETKLPISEGCRKAAEALSGSALDWALYGGEDYELLLTVPPAALAKARASMDQFPKRLFIIGEVVAAEDGIKMKTSGGEMKELPNRGWNHFST